MLRCWCITWYRDVHGLLEVVIFKHFSNQIKKFFFGGGGAHQAIAYYNCVYGVGCTREGL